MLKTESQEFDGIQFTTTQFPAMRGFALLTKLAKTVGPALGALAAIDPQADLSVSSPALMNAFATLEPADAVVLAKELLTNTSALITDEKGNQVNKLLATQEKIDDVFTGRVLVMLKVLAFVVKVNFADFMQGSILDAPATQKVLG